MSKSNELFGHPKGLFVLFFTELWERFSYYGMRAILVLYIVAKVDDKNPGLGWDNASALELYGWYTMLVYLMSIPGGILADKFLGQKKAVLVGGLLLCLGHGILAITDLWAFYTGLILIILGVGALKPNISTMVGQLYKQGDIRRDSGFTIFYIGINIGAFLASIIVGYVGESIGWHYGFGLAGIGMLLGQGVYMYGQKYLKGIGEAIKKNTDSAKAKEADRPLTKIEKDRIIVMLISFLIIIVFWGAFEQAGGLMNIYTKEKVNRMLFGWEIPASTFQALNPLFIMIFGTPVAWFWARRKAKGKEASSLFKMAVGTLIMGTGFLMMSGAALEAETAGKASLYWLIFAYLLHTLGELSASPVALSFITKLAPAKYASIMMGIYFAATGLGNKIAGLVGESAEHAGELQVFTGIFIFCAVFSGLLLLFLKKLKALTHGAEEGETHHEEQEPYELADVETEK
ncbi:MAG: MFS transporter [Bacteroidetes bacterium]|nr:MAG: MFS transporter [Bacteroidota bacterium]